MHRPETLRARARAVARFVIAAVVACAPSSLSAQRDDEREAPEIRSLELNGVRGVSRGDLSRSIYTTASGCRSVLLAPFCWLSRSPTFVERKYLNREEFRRDVLRILVFYWKRGYRNAEVDTTVTRHSEGAVRVAFNIREGPPTVISDLRVEYDSSILSSRRVRRLSILRPGDPLNLVVLDTMRINLQLALWDQGHADAEVDTIITVDTAQKRAAVLLKTRANWVTTIGNITVRGNEDVTARTIQNSLLLRPGNRFRYVDLTQTQKNLYETNLFSLALVTIAPRPDSVKDIEIEVRETKLQEGRVAGGFNNVDFIQVDGRYTNYDFFGDARRLDVMGVVGNLGASGLRGWGFFREPARDFFDENAFLVPTWQVAADVTQRGWLRPQNTISIGGFAHRRATPAVYIDRGYGSLLSFTRTLAPRATASAAYRFEIARVEASDVYFCVNYGVCDDATINSLRLHQRLSPVLLSAAIDRTDVPFSPTKGYLARIDLEHASRSTVSDFRFNRAFAEASAYTHFRYPSRDPRSQVIAGRIRLGYVRALAGARTGIELLHPRTRFYAGGSQSVRGYAENQLGPRILTIPPSELALAGCDTSSAASIVSCDPNSAVLENRDFTPRPIGGTSLIEGNVELRVPFTAKLSWAAFLDGAIVGGNELKSLTDITQLVSGSGAITPGVGVRYRSPVGPIRVDLGYNPRVREDLDVVTTAPDIFGRQELVTLDQRRSYVSGGNARGFWSIFNRVVLHLSIGQAF
jgi:outer membrane protein insertion porin family/translocation and assembly module TamA